MSDHRPLPIILHFRRPILTFILIGINVAIYLALKSKAVLDNDALARFWLFDDPARIWEGGYYTLLAAPFIHIEFFHILFNMLFLWQLGARIEIALGRQALFALVFFAAIISMGAQLAIHGLFGWHGWPAIGFSGVIYAMVGLMLTVRRQVPLFAEFLTPSLARFLVGWLFLCVVIDWWGVMSIGNAAHFSGILFGLAVGWLFVVRGARREDGARRRALAIRRAAGAAILAGLIAMTVASVTWMPWSPIWRQWRIMMVTRAGDWTTLPAYLSPQALRHDPIALNTHAWIRATSRDSRLRDGQQAVKLALEACALAKWREPSFIDTLAAAYAECGQWKLAEVTQEQAIRVQREWLEQMAPGHGAIAAHFLQPLEENLAKIRRREKIRE